jgi:uncharacterized protein (TIRG00374 family)
MRPTLRNLLLVLLVVVVLGALLYRSRRAITLEGFNWAHLVGAIREARLSLLLLAVAAVFVCYAIRALRWVAFSRYIGEPTFSNVYSATMIGFACVFLLGRAGEPIRPLLIARKDRLPVSSTFGIYVLERVFDVASTIALGGISLLLVPNEVLESGGDDSAVTAARTAGGVLLAGLLLVIAFLVYFRLHGAGLLERKLRVWHDATGWRKHFAGAFSGFSEGLQAIRGPRDLILAVIYSAAHWLLVAWTYLWVCHSFGGDLADLGFPEMMFVLAATMVGATLQLPGVGGGAQLASFLALTVFFGIEKEPAAAAAIVLWLITFATCTLLGVPLLIREGWSMRELWRLARRETQAEAIAAHAAKSRVGSPTERAPR